MEGSEGHAASGSSATRLRPRHPRIQKFLRALSRRAGPAAAPGSALGRHGDLPGAARFRCAARARDDAGARRRAVGQGRLRGPGHHQGGPARARHDGGARRLAEADPRIVRRRSRSGAPARRTIRPSTTRCRRPTRSACFRWKAARRWRRCRACDPTKFYDIVVQVAIIRPGPDRRQDGSPVHQAPAGTRAGRVPASVARAGAEAHARRAACFRSSCCAWR